MSVTHIRKIAHTRSAVEYEVLGGKGTRQRRENVAAGADRIAAITCDRATVEEFVDHAELMAAAHGRKIETLSLIQSFPADDFDVGNRDDIQAVNDLGYMLAKRLYPDSDALVITHVDGAGGHPHNHIKVINHDRRTGKVPTNTLHRQVAKANDSLMRELSSGGSAIRSRKSLPPRRRRARRSSRRGSRSAVLSWWKRNTRSAHRPTGRRPSAPRSGGHTKRATRPATSPACAAARRVC